MLNPSGFLAPSNEISSPFKIDWYHENYSSLEDMNGSTSYGRLVKAVQSIGLADIVINNSRSLLDDIEMDPA
jgi:hypothetical protein